MWGGTLRMTRTFFWVVLAVWVLGIPYKKLWVLGIPLFEKSKGVSTYTFYFWAGLNLWYKYSHLYFLLFGLTSIVGMSTHTFTFGTPQRRGTLGIWIRNNWLYKHSTSRTHAPRFCTTGHWGATLTSIVPYEAFFSQCLVKKTAKELTGINWGRQSPPTIFSSRHYDN